MLGPKVKISMDRIIIMASTYIIWFIRLRLLKKLIDGWSYVFIIPLKP